ncbi:MAG: hypothetical protein Q4P20_12095 [Eubacteriales bacterium]|nr:hypothetical protein [Eubacteriales bacterium]
MIFCRRRECPAGRVTVFDMPLSCLKWRVKNFTTSDIYVSVDAFAEQNNMRIAPGGEDVVVDRDPQTGTRKTCRRIAIYAAAAGEVEIVCG